MLIIYGKKRVPRVQLSSAAMKCPHCYESCPIVVLGCSEYFYLYWIPFFGWKSAVCYCSNCERTLKDGYFGRYDKDLSVKIPEEARRLAQQLRSEVHVPWYYYAGSATVVALVLYAMMATH
jgi:hypothetical protein